MSTLTYQPTKDWFESTASYAISPEATNLSDMLRRIQEATEKAETLRSQAKQELEDTFLDCMHPNWDGYDALPVSVAGFQKAQAFLNAIPMRFPVPSVSALPSGSISLEWSAPPNRRFIVSISDDPEIAFAGLFPEQVIKGASMFIHDIPSSIAYYLNKVFL